MKTDIILVGVGGQGILSIANAIGTAALNNNLHVKQAETHGMSQRGGAVVSHMRLSDKSIYSDLIPLGEADLILSVEPMEALRYLPYLSKTGYIVTNITPFINIPNYPSIDSILEKLNRQERVVTINADKYAEELGSKLVSNMIMLGAASPFLNHIEFSSLESGLISLFAKKGEELVNTNLNAIKLGKKIADEVLTSKTKM